MNNNRLSKFLGSINPSHLPIYGFSEDHKKFISSDYKCLECDKTLSNGFSVNINLYSENGDKIVGGFFTKLFDKPFRRDLIVECPYCNHRWNMHGKSNLIRPSKSEVVKIIPIDRSEEIWGTDKRIFDNSTSASEMDDNITISKEWSKSYSIQWENIQVNGTVLNLELPKTEIANIKLTCQETLKQQYSISEGTKETFTHVFLVKVPAYKKRKVMFTWKRIWQNGLIRFRHQDNTEFDVPFQVAMEMTFDRSQSDE